MIQRLPVERSPCHLLPHQRKFLSGTRSNPPQIAGKDLPLDSGGIEASQQLGERLATRDSAHRDRTGLLAPQSHAIRLVIR